jgi:hypothetical protein
MIAAIVRPTLARLGRPRPVLLLAAWFALSIGFALAARAGGAAHGADHALVDAFGSLVLPLVAYSLVGILLGRRSLPAAIAPLVSFGASPRLAAGVTLAAATIACVAAGALLAPAVAVVAHGVGDPPLLGDAVVSAYAGALGGAAYATWFALGASLGRRGGGRAALLVLDWLLGAGRGVSAVVTPRAHLRSLLGGAAPLGWPERASAVVLLVLTAACAAGAVIRSRRP